MTDPVDFKIGDMVHPLKLWNRTERLENQLPDPVEILDIAVGRQVSQTRHHASRARQQGRPTLARLWVVQTMTDLVKRLRDYADCYTATTYHHALIQEAANEIERLRAGGCARDQTTTQFCAEAQALSEEVARLRRQIANLGGELKAASACEISGRVRERCAKECDIWKTQCGDPLPPADQRGDRGEGARVVGGDWDGMTRGLRLTQSDLDRMVRDRPTLQHRLDFGDKKRKPRPVKVKAPVPSEFQVQSAFVKWTRLASVRRMYPDLAHAFHVPNGELRGRDQKEARRIGAKLKALGQLRGVADWILLAPTHRYHGLIIEFKRPGGKVEPGGDQDVWLRYQRAQGYCVHVLTDWERARDLVVGYLRGELEGLA